MIIRSKFDRLVTVIVCITFHSHICERVMIIGKHSCNNSSKWISQQQQQLHVSVNHCCYAECTYSCGWR
jgi:hypothetical protein